MIQTGLGARARMALALLALCGAGACLPLAVVALSTGWPSWLWVAVGMASLAGAGGLLLGAPLPFDSAAGGFENSDEIGISRNADLRKQLLFL